MKMRVGKPAAKIFAAFAAVLLAAAGAYAQNHVPKVEKVEPPSWWAGHTINPVRVLVRGEYLHDVFGPRGGPFEVSNVKVNDARTYMFFDLHVSPGTPP